MKSFHVFKFLLILKNKTKIPNFSKIVTTFLIYLVVKSADFKKPILIFGITDTLLRLENHDTFSVSEIKYVGIFVLHQFLTEHEFKLCVFSPFLYGKKKLQCIYSIYVRCMVL